MSGRWWSDSGASDPRRKTRNSCASLEARPDLFPITFLRLRVQDIPRLSPRFPPSVLPLAIKSDLTSIYLRILSLAPSHRPLLRQSTRRHRRSGPSLSFFPSVRAESTLRMNFAYKPPITFFSSTVSANKTGGSNGYCRSRRWK